MAQPPVNPILDARVQARRQKDLDGYNEYYQSIVDKRVEVFGMEILFLWRRIREYLSLSITDLFRRNEVNGKLPDSRSFEEERLRLLKNNTSWLIKQMEGQQLKMANNIAFQYADAYYFTAFAVEQTAKVAVTVPLVSGAQVMGIINNPWLPDGNTYSDRLRANTAYLAEKMVTNVEMAVGQGLSVPETARKIEATADESYSNAVRLARTELNRAASLGQSHMLMENADVLDGKRWNATLDSRTAPKDADNDGKTFPLDYDTPENPGKPGARIPNHPNCRCKYSPILSAFGGETVKERIARGEGDTPQKFGERTYTKARTYREYAKERGLPDLDERLKNDNPKSYLRRGETMAAYGNANE